MAARPLESAVSKNKNDPHRRTDEGLEVGSGGRIRTYDLWVMSPASYRAAPPRDVVWITLVHRGVNKQINHELLSYFPAFW